jgi:hypothetical protein
MVCACPVSSETALYALHLTGKILTSLQRKWYLVHIIPIAPLRNGVCDILRDSEYQDVPEVRLLTLPVMTVGEIMMIRPAAGPGQQPPAAGSRPASKVQVLLSAVGRRRRLAG